LGWEPAQVISEPVFGQNFNIAGMPGGVQIKTDIDVENGVIHTIWTETNNTNGAGIDADVIYRKYSKLCLEYPEVTPHSGNTSTYFNFTVTYSHFKNIGPTKMILNLSSVGYTLLESDPGDTNYVDGKDYYYSTNHLNIGVHSYRFHASDGLAEAVTAVKMQPVVYNTRPEILTQDNLTAYEDEFYETDYEYEDIDYVNVGQLATWNCSTDAGWLGFDPLTAILSGTPADDEVGKYWVNISVNDSIEITFTNFTLTVENVNDDPMINTTDVVTTYEDELYSVDYNATDIDSDVELQVWSLSTNATAWLDIDTGTGLISGIPTNDDVGKHWVNVSVEDGDLGLAYTNYTLIVLNVNDYPIITTEDVLEAPVYMLYEVDYNATDIDNSPSELTWSLDGNVGSWLSIDSSTGVLSGKPGSADVGEFAVNVTVDDGAGGFDWHYFELMVTPLETPDNDPPVITTSDKVSVTAGNSYNVIYDATDDRTPLASLIWVFDSNTTWLSFGQITRTLSGTPTLSDVGRHWVNVSVFDGEGGFDSHNFTLTVWSTENQDPTILTVPVKNAVVDELYSVDYEANDDHTPDEYLLWSMGTNASWLNLDNKTGLLSGTPRMVDLGWYPVTISVTDGEDGWDNQFFIIYVTKEPMTILPPELSNPAMTPTGGNTTTEFTFSVDYSHPYDDPPDSIQVVIDGVRYDMVYTNGHYEYKTKLSESNHTYFFTASLAEFTVNSDTFITGHISKVTVLPVEEDGDDDDEEDYTWLFAYIAMIVVVIVVLILMVMFVIKRKKAEEEPMAEQPAVPDERVKPEELVTEQPPAPIPEQPPVSAVPLEQIPSPETPPPEPTPSPEAPPPQPLPQVKPATEPVPQPTVTQEPVADRSLDDEELEE
jgi:hypothetical protein